jgi:thiol:disulfide interchange protein DsbC
MFSRVFIAALAVVTSIASSWALAGEPVAQELADKLQASLEVPGTGLKVQSVKASEIPGLYEVQFINGPMIYSTVKGDYFILGDMFGVEPDGYVNLAEKRRDGERVEQLASVKLEDMIIFSPEGETRASVTVFTDVSCFYCQKLHKEVPELNKRGVEVRYLAYPRAGVSSEAYRQLASAWCADNKQETMTALKNRESVEENVCPGNPVAAHYLLGQKMGVRGTPAIVTETGQMIPGYQSADDLIVTLGLN